MDIQYLLNTPKSQDSPNLQDISRTLIPDSQEPNSQEPDSQEIPDSQEVLDSPEIPDSQGSQKSIHTTRDDRIAIRTALLFGHSQEEIYNKLKVTKRQIQIAKNSPLTPQKNKHGHVLLSTPKRQQLETWLLASPSHRRVRFDLIPFCAPHLNLDGVGRQAIRTAFKKQGYVQRTSPKKGFSDDPRVMQERVAFAKEGIT